MPTLSARTVGTSVETAEIADDAITNAKVSASAAIARSKLDLPVKARRGSGSNLAETFGATNGGAAPGTSKLSVERAASARLVAFQVRVRAKGTINTNAHATVRAVTAAPANRDSAEATAGATDQFLNLGSIRTQAGDVFATPAWNATETSGTFNFAALLTDADEITKVEVFVRRSNTTDAIEWEAQIVAWEL